jgi:hypothetical protein
MQTCEHPVVNFVRITLIQQTAAPLHQFLRSIRIVMNFNHKTQCGFLTGHMGLISYPLANIYSNAVHLFFLS